MSTVFSKVVHRILHAFMVWGILWTTGRRKPVGKAVGKSGWFGIPAAADFSFCFFFFYWGDFVYDTELH